MKLIIGRYAGFCYGVRRAVTMAEGAAPDCCALGELIHNHRELDRLQSLGIRTVLQSADVADGAAVLIRSHGEPEAVVSGLRARGCRILDATCPNVARIHRLVRRAAEQGRLPIASGTRGTRRFGGSAGVPTASWRSATRRSFETGSRRMLRRRIRP